MCKLHILKVALETDPVSGHHSLNQLQMSGDPRGKVFGRPALPDCSDADGADDADVAEDARDKDDEQDPDEEVGGDEEGRAVCLGEGAKRGIFYPAAAATSGGEAPRKR